MFINLIFILFYFIFYNIFRHVYELNIIKGRLGMLYLKWEKREAQGQVMIDEAKKVLDGLSHIFPSKIALSQTLQFPLILK